MQFNHPRQRNKIYPHGWHGTRRGRPAASSHGNFRCPCPLSTARRARASKRVSSGRTIILLLPPLLLLLLLGGSFICRRIHGIYRFLRRGQYHVMLASRLASFRHVRSTGTCTTVHRYAHACVKVSSPAQACIMSMSRHNPYCINTRSLHTLDSCLMTSKLRSRQATPLRDIQEETAGHILKCNSLAQPKSEEKHYSNSSCPASFRYEVNICVSNADLFKRFRARSNGARI